jgi:hypothetical protein
MDMLPPDTPAKGLHGDTREVEVAGGALRRLASAHRRLIDWQTLGPRPPDELPGSLDAFLVEAERFWSGRKAELGKVIADVMRDEAALRAADGTLDARGASVARRVSESSTAALAPGVHAYEVMLGDHALAAALVAHADDTPGHYLLFLPGLGWETFPSLDVLTESMRRRFFEWAISADAVYGLAPDQFTQARQDDTVSVRPLGPSAFITLAERVLEVQRDQISQARDDYQLDADLPGATLRFSDRVQAYLDLPQHLGIPRILQARENRLHRLAQAERLGNVPRVVADSWRDAWDSYARLTLDAAALRTAIDANGVESVVAFTDRELSTHLQALGVTDTPADLVVEITHDPTPGSYEHLKGLVGGETTVRQTLRELAWRGLASAEPVRLRLSRSDGEAVSVSLSTALITTLVSQANIPNRYRKHLEDGLRAKPRGRLAKAIDVEMEATRMRADAAEARLSYYLPGEPRAFRDDHAERGFRWVTAALDARGTTRHPKVEGHEIVVRQLTYKGIPLRDVFLFGVRQPHSVPTVVLYTPDAPDGRAFREFDDRQAAARGFLYAPAFREYVLDRLPVAFAERDDNGVTRRFAGDRLANWVLGSANTDGYTQTAEPFEERDLRGDFVAAGYDAKVDQRIHDAYALQQDARRWSFNAIATHPLGGLLADAAWETLRAPARARQALDRFYDGVKAGDHVEAYLAFTDAYTSALDIVTPPWLSGKARAPLIRPAAGRAPTRAPFELFIPARPFEPRFEAPGVALRGVTDANGVYVVAGRRYIRHGSKVYRVRYDDAFDTWRLQPPNGSAVAWGPAIRREDTGVWTYSEVGLAGGAGRRLRDRFRRLLHLGDEAGGAPQVQGAANPPGPAAGPLEPPLAVRLPAELEPRRAEFEAVLRDNPGANLLTRRGSNDSLHVRLEMPSRSAILYEDGVAADLRALSAAKRRQFMHELEARFPETTERGQVLAERGWARDGHRLPSADHHRWRGDDGQDPAISSSRDTPTAAADALSPDQHRRWDEAVAAARAHGDAADTVPGAAPRTYNAALRGAAEVLEPDEWPRQLWIYVDHPPVRRMGREGNELVLRGGNDGSLHAAHNFQATTLPPGTPAARLDEVLGVTPAHRLAGRDPLAHWVQVDTRYMVDAFRRPNHALARRLLPDGEYAYTLHTWGNDLRLPVAYTRTSAQQP